MRLLQWPFVAVMVLAIPLVLGQGCPPSASEPEPQYTQADLTDVEKSAVDSVVEACAALAQSTSMAQNAADDTTSPNGRTFGTCPVVTTGLATEGEGNLTVDLNMDFGAGCAPLEGYACSGSASGTFTQFSRHIGLAFNNITCNADTLAGTADVTYSITSAGVGLVGQFNLTWVSGTDSIATSGNGSYNYHRGAAASTITTFDGSITDSNGTYTVNLADVVVSYTNNAVLIPSAGVSTLTQPNGPIRRISVRFNSTSPATGDVEVSINGSEFFPVNIYTL
ncbi:MAG: hypothetical protein AMXMBFR13_23500 [Phycisphaerae bacterium]